VAALAPLGVDGRRLDEVARWLLRREA